MHSFLKAIGFSNINNRVQVEELINRVVSDATEKKLMAIGSSSTMAELSMEISDGIGVTVRGEYDEADKFHVEHYFPYCRGQNISTREEVYISKRVDTDAYTGMCDDYRLGVSLIFYIQNVIDYLSSNQDEKKSQVRSVILAGLSCEGKILLPVNEEERMEEKRNLDVHQRNHLIAEAKKGNQEAIDSLTVDDIDLYALISRRIENEDVYSIVSTSFIPYGSESDNYTVLGKIIDVKKRKNSITKEALYLLTIECNDLSFEVCINEKDLFGEPLVGRRFQGNLWMQGEIDFY